MTIGMINTAQPYTGIGNYSFSLFEALKGLVDIDHVFFDSKQFTVSELTTSKQIASTRRIPIVDNNPFFYYRMQGHIPKYDLYLLTNQNISFFNVAPKVITCHDIIHEMYPASKMHQMAGKMMYKGLKNAEHIITDSDATASDLQCKYGISKEKMTTVYLGIDHEMFRPVEEVSSIWSKYNLEKDKEYILHISSEQPRKNVEGIIKAFYRLKKESGRKDLVLLKAGEPQYPQDRKNIMSLITSLGLENDIYFLGRVSNEDLIRLYCIAKMFVFPSFYEGFGLPVIEAMACGCPVITSSVSSLPEIAGNACIIVDPEDYQEMSSSMLELFQDDDLRSSLTSKGINRAAQFSWEKCANETAKVCARVLEGI
ncbi:glycosyltransferase family 1 protein [uncultured Methanomethylovorans sp.]|uniref:glycosyltransferase family 4 protein n=1 Tax=uncultured Methanomethylovorans sp. TaxID=183759 RepID=UPI002AA79A37|nr:glycosyltransferase family 1 protein [uncultured Methanomethylovorans sp.]